MNFEKIYATYNQKILRFTYNYTKDSLEQEDLVQEIFLNIFQALKKFKKRSSLNTYIYSIARNTCINFLKKDQKAKKIAKEVLNSYVENYEENPLDKFILSEEMEYFLSVLYKIPEKHREIFILSEVERLSYRDISEVLEIPTGTVKSRISRAKEAIADLLTANEEIS